MGHILVLEYDRAYMARYHAHVLFQKRRSKATKDNRQEVKRGDMVATAPKSEGLLHNRIPPRRLTKVKEKKRHRTS